MHIVYTMTGGKVTDHRFLGVTSLKSILMTRHHGRSRHREMHIHILLGPTTKHLFNENEEARDVAAYIASDPLLHLHLHDFDALEAAAAAAVGAELASAIDTNIFKPGSGARLKIPFLLTDVPRVIYVDWDTSAVCDIGNFWDQFAYFNDTQFFGLTWEDSTGGTFGRAWYRGKKTGCSNIGGFNAGILMWDMERMRQMGLDKRYWEIAAEIVHKGGYMAYEPGIDAKKGLELGDQDVLNIMSYLHKDWFFEFPPQFSWRWASRDNIYWESHVWDTHPTAPCLLHFAGSRLTEDNHMFIREHTALFFYYKTWRMANATGSLPLVAGPVPKGA